MLIIRIAVKTIKKQGGRLESIFRNFLNTQHLNRQFQEHFLERLIKETNEILDGVHRLLKAHLQNDKKINVKYITLAEMRITNVLDTHQ